MKMEISPFLISPLDDTNYKYHMWDMKPFCYK